MYSSPFNRLKADSATAACAGGVWSEDKPTSCADLMRGQSEKIRKLDRITRDGQRTET